MTRSSDRRDFLPGRAETSALPVRPVRVHAALSQREEWRIAMEVCEWMVEPVAEAGAQGLSLTLVLSDDVSLSFLLQAQDAEDLSCALDRPQP